eukprot:1157896-Pelagomonas_calceolata.AAC.8
MGRACKVPIRNMHAGYHNGMSIYTYYHSEQHTCLPCCNIGTSILAMLSQVYHNTAARDTGTGDIHSGLGLTSSFLKMPVLLPEVPSALTSGWQRYRPTHCAHQQSDL